MNQCILLYSDGHKELFAEDGMKMDLEDKDRQARRNILEGVVKDDMPGKRASFLALAARLRRETEGRAQTPSEILIREDRENGHRVIR